MKKDLKVDYNIEKEEQKKISATAVGNSQLGDIVEPLLAWYDTHARVLPWREHPAPYRVWVSEIMLQQTRVEAVKPYFERFMTALPTIRDLAEAPEDVILKLWEGLGYYNRARNLKKAAGVIMSDYGGHVPETYEELLKLPGIGSYTAGAISSIAFGYPVPAVDGNVLRVLSRVLESHEDILKQSVKKHFEELLRETMPKERTSAFTQGMIEIGAIVCVPNGKPKCEECPLESLCLAKRHGLLDSIPYKAPKKPRKIEEKTVLLICSSKKAAIRKRPDQGLLASLYEFPNTDHYLTADEVREYLEKEMAALGCRVYPSQSNFIYFDTGKDPAWIQEQLMEKGIRIGAFEMSRVSVGTMEECKLYIKALKEILEAAE